MKISDEISLSARNLLRRKGRTALTLVGVVIGTCMVVLMISLGIAQTKTNEEMLQSWGDLTQVQIYGYGMMQGSDGKPLYLDDAAIANIKQIPHVAAGQRGHIGAGRVAAFQHKGQHRGVGGRFPLCRKAQMQRNAAAVEFRSIQRCNANAGRELFTFQIVIPFKHQ